MVGYLLVILSLSLGINMLGFLVAFYLKTDKLTDFSYALSFASLALLSLFVTQNINLPNLVIVGMVLLWALRLGSYLVIRINKWGRDKRFDEMRGNFVKFFQFWLIQGITAWVVSLNFLTFVYLNQAQGSTLQLVNYLGLGIFIACLLIEALADVQKFNFINLPKNKGKFIDTGLWRHNRHPNYFGEIGCWSGIFVYSLSALESWQVLIGLVSPLFIFVMIRFISGVPILEKQAEKRWGEQTDYRKYKKQSGLLWFKISI